MWKQASLDAPAALGTMRRTGFVGHSLGANAAGRQNAKAAIQSTGASSSGAQTKPTVEAP
jgi:predicted alpha/beta hydrolase